MPVAVAARGAFSWTGSSWLLDGTAPMTERMPAFFIVGGGASYLPLLKAARRDGLYVVVIDRDSDAPAGRVAHRFARISTHDTAAMVELVGELERERGLAGVFTYASDARALESTAVVAQEFDLPGPTPGLVRLLADKGEMKRVLQASGVPTPRWAIASKESEAVEFGRSLSGPVLLKPASGTVGSLGVSRPEGIDGIGAAFHAAATRSLDERVLVEALVPGEELSVNGMVVEDEPCVLAVCRKRNHGPERNFMISGFSTLDPEDKRATAASRIAGDAARALGIRDSFFAADVIVNEGAATLLEIGLLLDAKIDRLLAFTGADIYTCTCALATGGIGPAMTPCPDGFALRFLYGLEADRGGPSPNGRPWVVEWERDRFPSASLADSFGWVLCRGEDSETADRLSREVAERCGATLSE